ncbi:TIGR01244 family phosphatase [Seongchinamella unica]|uniref:TIGR01244 family phosphatase n=1 Tax=Seongchinamella unica TaxID=2547392 RepID=A0A4R5LNP5_9GAMM|nr:TIGR01244 family sulfur transferase [Seongchinamella unica]TDG11982.1 TIGR01244 family phosphatase [Seongchinamella unica]
MNSYKLTDTVAVAGQITSGLVDDIAAAGYKVLLNNRPDGEEPGQPTSAEIAAAAEAAGLEYHHIPVTAMNFPGEHLNEMADLFDDEERPVFAFCRTGTRCTNLWVVSRQPEERAAAVAHAQAIGFDLSMAARALS